jgi:hypothetical protein
MASYALRDVTAFRGGARRTDDVTVMAIQRADAAAGRMAAAS